MPLWTNGEAFVVANGWGIARCEKGRAEVHRIARKELDRDAEPPPVVFLAVLDPTGSSALFRCEGESAHHWALGDEGPKVAKTKGPEILDALALGDGRLLVVTPTKKGDTLELRQATHKGATVTLGDAVSLPPAPPLAHPSEIWPDWTWPEDRKGDTDDPRCASGFDVRRLAAADKKKAWIGTVELFSSPAGIGVSSTYSGTVAVLDPSTLAPRLVARVPTDVASFRAVVCPTPDGALVALVCDRRQTEYLLLSNAGEVVAHRHKLGAQLAYATAASPVLIADDEVLIGHDHDQTYRLSLPSLRAKRVSERNAPVEEASSADGSAQIVAYASRKGQPPHTWDLVLHRRRLRDRSLPCPDLRPPSEARPGLPTVKGPAVLGVVADTTPWAVDKGDEVELRLQISNQGGPLEGVYAEVAGPALQSKLAAPVAVRVGDESIPFKSNGSVARVEVPTFSLGAAPVIDPTLRKKDRPPYPSQTLGLTIRGAGAGNALLTIRVGPLEADGKVGSALQGRTLLVRDGA